MTASTPEKKVHHGRNIKRFRELFGIKQEALAIDLGQDWSQKKVSRLEEHEVIEDDVLEQVAKILQLPVAAIKNFTEEAAITYFNTYNDNSGSGSCSNYSTFHFNNSEDYLKLLDENKQLYERLLTLEREKVALLEKLLEQKK